MLTAISTTYALTPPHPKAMMIKTCQGLAQRWRRAEANVAVSTPTQGNVAAQKRRVGVVIRFKPVPMTFKGSNILVGRHIRLG